MKGERPGSEVTGCRRTNFLPYGLVNGHMGSSRDAQKEHHEIIREQIRTGFQEYRNSGLKTFLSAFTAGLEIGFSVLLMSILYSSLKDYLPAEILHLIVAFGYPVGFLFVMIGRSELFTEQTALALLPVLNKKAGISELFRMWGSVFSGNILGTILIAIFLSWIGPALKISSAASFVHIADQLLHLPWHTMLGSAVLAGWMMGLAGWLLSSAQETISRIVMIVLVTLIIGMGSLHHCIAGSVEILCGVLLSDGIHYTHYLHFMLFTTLGNIVGGSIFVAGLKYGQLHVSDKDAQ